MMGSSVSVVADEVFGLRCWHGAASVMEGAHRHDEIELNLVSGGSLDYLIAGEHLHVPGETLLLFWANRPHQLIATTGRVEVRWLTVPLEVFLGWQLPAELRAGLVGGVPLALATGADTSEHLTQWTRWEHDLDRGDAELTAVVLLEMEARLRRLAHQASAVPASAGRTTLGAGGARRGTDRLIAMTGFISAHFREPIQVADVAAAAHVHPHHAMTLFRRGSGVTISTFLTQCRVAEAQRLLLATDRPITQIAYACGFGSLARFYQAFRAVCGQPPGQYRRTAPPLAASPEA